MDNPLSLYGPKIPTEGNHSHRLEVLSMWASLVPGEVKPGWCHLYAVHLVRDWLTHILPSCPPTYVCTSRSWVDTGWT